MNQCSRCGSEGEVEYGSDGLPYCTSCIFYGINKTCFRCRMYLPASELQQYKGQLVCPYCMMDMRSEERGIEARSEGEKHAEGIQAGETCERCGRSISTIYRVGGMRLCQSCADEAKREWKDVGGERPPMPMYRVKEKAVKESGLRSFFESVLSEALALVGIKKNVAKESEIVAMQKMEKRQQPRSTIHSAVKDEEQEPMIEGPEKKEKKKPKKSQDVSFSEFKPQEKEKKKKKFNDFKND